MPGEPNIEVENDEGSKGVTVSVTYDDTDFFLYYSEFPTQVDPEKWLRALRDGHAILGRDSLKGESPLLINGFPGREFRFEKTGLFVISRNFVLANRTISAVVWSLSRPRGVAESQAIPRFLNSLVLLPRPG